MKIPALLLSLFLMTGCFVEHNRPLLIGSWDTIDWTVTQNGEKITNQMMIMTYGEDDRYEVDYGGEKEVGKWWVVGNNLHTQEDGFAQKMVKITHLEGDTLKFEMNRSGRIEEVVLLKK